MPFSDHSGLKITKILWIFRKTNIFLLIPWTNPSFGWNCQCNLITVPPTFHPQGQLTSNRICNQILPNTELCHSAILPCGNATWGQDIHRTNKKRGGWSGNNNCQTTPLARPTASQHNQQQQKPPSTQLNHPASDPAPPAPPPGTALGHSIFRPSALGRLHYAAYLELISFS